MNKSVAVLAGGIILTVVGWQALAQAPNGARPNTNTPNTNPPATSMSAPAAPGTRVCVVNMNKVLKNFNKAQQLNKFISDRVNNYGQQITAKRDQIAKMQADMGKELVPANVENMRKQMVQLEREMQDLDAEARKDITNQQGTIAIGIYKDIEGVINRCAVANGFDIVLSFPDATSEAEMYAQPNVVRKLASQAAIPIFYKPHVDLTDAVVQTLNATFPVAAVPPPTTPTPGGPAPGTNPTIVPTSGTAQPKKP